MLYLPFHRFWIVFTLPGENTAVSGTSADLDDFLPPTVRIFGFTILDGDDRVEKFLCQGAGPTAGNLIVRVPVAERGHRGNHGGRTRTEYVFQLACPALKFHEIWNSGNTQFRSTQHIDKLLPKKYAIYFKFHQRLKQILSPRKF